MKTDYAFDSTVMTPQLNGSNPSSILFWSVMKAYKEVESGIRMGILVWKKPDCNGRIHCVWWRKRQCVPEKIRLKTLTELNQVQTRDHWPGEKSWCERSFAGANRPSPDRWGRHSAHTPQYHHLPLKTPLGCRKWHHPISNRPSSVHSDCRPRHGWDGLPPDKCGTRVGFPRNLRILSKKTTGTSRYPETRGPIESSSSRAKTKVDRPQDFSYKLNPREHVYESRKKGVWGNPHPGYEKKQMGLTSHSTAMDLVIQAPGNGVVPRQRFSQIPQLFMGAYSEQGVQTFVTHREAV